METNLIVGVTFPISIIIENGNLIVNDVFIGMVSEIKDDTTGQVIGIRLKTGENIIYYSSIGNLIHKVRYELCENLSSIYYNSRVPIKIIPEDTAE